MTPYLQDVIEWRLYFIFSFFCICSFVLGQSHFSFLLPARANSLISEYYSILQYVSAVLLVFYMFTPIHSSLLTAYPETKGVPLEEMDIVFREGTFLSLSHVHFLINFFQLSILGGQHKETRYSFDEGRASYAPLREDHDHDHDDHYDVGDPEEHGGEDYEMIERNLGRES